MQVKVMKLILKNIHFEINKTTNKRFMTKVKVDKTKEIS